MTTEPQNTPSRNIASNGTSGPCPRGRVVQSDQLLQGHRELRIVHGGEVYRLLVTRNNKLILQK